MNCRKALIITWGAIILFVFLIGTQAKADDDVVRVRVTFYTLQGCMASSGRTCVYTHKDAAACSRQYPFGTQFQFQDGYVVTCEDRGLGDYYWPQWIDIWAPSYAWGIENVERDYGTYTDVTIVRWGWGD